MAGLQAAAGGPLVAAAMRAAQTAVPALRAKGWAVRDPPRPPSPARPPRPATPLPACGGGGGCET